MAIIFDDTGYVDYGMMDEAYYDLKRAKYALVRSQITGDPIEGVKDDDINRIFEDIASKLDEIKDVLLFIAENVTKDD
jgi:hypothetical protein